MFPIIEVFLGFSIGVAILWVTVLALVKFTRRVISGEEWQDALKDLWKSEQTTFRSPIPRPQALNQSRL